MPFSTFQNNHEQLFSYTKCSGHGIQVWSNKRIQLCGCSEENARGKDAKVVDIRENANCLLRVPPHLGW